jgi:hypothetical protein
MHASVPALRQGLGLSCPRMATAVVVTVWVWCLYLRPSSSLSNVRIDSHSMILPSGDQHSIFIVPKPRAHKLPAHRKPV